MDYSKLNIAVIGDLILDRYMFCNRESVSGEKLSLSCEKSISTLGGAGNVVKMLASLGCKVDFITRANKLNRDRVSALLKPFPNVHFHVLYDLLPQNEVIQLGGDTSATIRSLHIVPPLPLLLKYIDTTPFESSVCILSDYGTEWITRELVVEVQKKWSTTIVDPKGHNPSKWKGCSIVKPNGLELIGNSIDEYGNSTLCITEGNDGLTYMSGSRSTQIHIPAATIPYYKDSIGAGDGVVSGIACALVSGKTYHEACRIGNIFGGAACCCEGTYETLTTQLIEEISRLNNVEF